MKKYIVYFIIIFICVPGSRGTSRDKINSYFDKPLFNFSLEKNNLPVGNFRLLRSYEEVTQILESIDGHTVVLHIDRDNRIASQIFSSAYSRFHNVFLDTREISQVDFNRRVEHLIRSGDQRKRSTQKYPGLNKFCNYVRNSKSKIKKEDLSYLIRFKDNFMETKLKLNYYDKNLFISNSMNKGSNFILYLVHIKDSYDRNILKLIREYTAKLYRIRNNDGS